MNIQEQTTASPVVIAGETTPLVETPPTGEPGVLYILTCLLIGGTVEIADLLLTRARLWRTTIAAQPKLLPAPDDESNGDLVRYVLIGLLIEAEQRLHDQSLWLGNLLLRAADLATAVARPVTQSWLLAPVRPSFSALARRGEAELARLIDQGRLEEVVSRLLTRELADEMVALVLAYLGEKPEVRDLIQAQGTSLAGEVVDEVRDRSKTADTLMEAMVHRLFKLAPRTPPSPPAT